MQSFAMLITCCDRPRYRDWRRQYSQVYDKFIDPKRLPEPVRIAILDTGINREHDEIEARADRIKETRNFHEPTKKGVFDRNGHGTFDAGLILDYAPDAELYVGKIADSENATPDAKIIADVRNSIESPLLTQKKETSVFSGANQLDRQ